MIQTNRRAFIAGSATAVVAASLPAVALASPVDRRAWEHAMARYKAAEQEAEVYDATVFDPLYERERAFEKARGVDLMQPGFFAKRNALYREHGTAHVVPEAINAEHDRLWEVASDLKWEVMKVEAPDQSALRWKIESLLEDTRENNATQIALADAVRLLPQGR